ADTLSTYTIITTSSSDFLSFIHDRMPVILENDSDCLAKWMDPNIRWCSEFEELLKPYEGELEWFYPVSQDVGNVSNDYPSLINPITKANITSFFSGKKDEIKDKKSKSVINQEENDIKESTSVSIPAKRSLDDLNDDIKDDFTSNEGNDLKRSHKLPLSPPDETSFNNEDSDTEQSQAPSS
ncbi:7252_t:CDS:2, partial [Dentiscutata heterogama]